MIGFAQNQHTEQGGFLVTECTHQPLLFTSLKRQKVVADFDGGQLSSDGGALLLREVDRRLGFTRSLAECICKFGLLFLLGSEKNAPVILSIPFATRS